MCCEIRAIKSLEEECVRNVLGISCQIRALRSLKEECVRNVLSNKSSKESRGGMC